MDSGAIKADAVINNLTDGIIAIDQHGIVALLNPSAEVILERGTASVQGRKIDEAELHPEIGRVALECLSKGEPTDAEVKLGGWPPRVIRVTATPVTDEHGKVIFATVDLHDITRVRQYENSQREFVGNVSHELKTPLTSIRATSEALLAGAMKDEALLERFLSTIVAETDRLTILIDDLLELARLDAGVALSRKKVVGVLDMVNRAAKVIVDIAADRNVSLQVDVDPNVSTYCDDVQMVQAIRNLIENAVKYTNDGDVVRVWTELGADKLRIRVSDHGIGIAGKDLSHVFERFYRVDKSRGKITGTGLGLSIVKSIVESHGGAISVESKLGEGSTFTIILPNTWAADEI